MKNYQTSSFLNFYLKVSLLFFVFFFRNSFAYTIALDETKWILNKELSLAPVEVNQNLNGKLINGLFGNVKFSFPGNMVSEIEYETELGWGGSRSIKNKKLDHDINGIRSLYMRMRIDSHTMDNLDSKTSVEQRKIYQDRIVTVGLNANSYFGNGNGLEKMTEIIAKSAIIKYEQNPSLSYGLISYVPVKQSYESFDDKARLNLKKSEKEYFFTRNSHGRVSTFIDCSKNAPTNNTCRQVFYPDSKLPVELSITYSKKYLPYWMELQNKTTDIFLSYESK